MLSHFLLHLVISCEPVGNMPDAQMPYSKVSYEVNRIIHSVAEQLLQFNFRDSLKLGHKTRFKHKHLLMYFLSAVTFFNL